MSKPKYSRILLKLSGEAFAPNDTGYGIDAEKVAKTAQEISKVLSDTNVQIAIVVGGGNIFRGMAGASRGMDRARADYMGMLATVINGLALQDAFEAIGQESRVQSAITMAQVAESYIPLRAIRHMEKGRVVIFTAGTGMAFIKIDETTYLDVINKGLKVMDSTALTFCMDNHLPIVVFDVETPGNIEKVVMGDKIGTTVELE